MLLKFEAGFDSDLTIIYKPLSAYSNEAKCPHRSSKFDATEYEHNIQNPLKPPVVFDFQELQVASD